MSFAAAEADRMIANTLMLGKVVSVNPETPAAVVSFGELVSPPLSVGQLRAGALSFWWMPAPGEQVLVGCPSGDIAQGVILCAVFAGNAPSSNPAVPMIDLAGGELHVNGTLVVSGDVTASGISLVNHTHRGVVAGNNNTGAPN